jgi:hypothetical protein
LLGVDCDIHVKADTRTAIDVIGQVDSNIIIKLTLQGMEVQLQESDRHRSPNGSLLALPLGASSSKEACTSCPWQWPPLDYRDLVQRVASWHVNGTLPLCPMCAGVAYYQGPNFTRSDIQTGWNAFLLCGSSVDKEPNPLLATLWANAGISFDAAPPIAIQLRPDENLYTGELHELSELWRGHGQSSAQYVVSASFPCSKRFRIDGKTFFERGIDAYCCDQMGKYALTSRTRVGRYLDDQPAQQPRAHVFGHVCGDCNRALLSECADRKTIFCEEMCPFCGKVGVKLRNSSIAFAIAEGSGCLETFAEDDWLPFSGELWICETAHHMWGWRPRARAVCIHEQ